MVCSFPSRFQSLSTAYLAFRCQKHMAARGATCNKNPPRDPLTTENLSPYVTLAQQRIIHTVETAVCESHVKFCESFPCGYEARVSTKLSSQPPPHRFPLLALSCLGSAKGVARNTRPQREVV